MSLFRACQLCVLHFQQQAGVCGELACGPVVSWGGAGSGSVTVATAGGRSFVRLMRLRHQTKLALASGGSCLAASCARSVPSSSSFSLTPCPRLLGFVSGVAISAWHRRLLGFVQRNPACAGVLQRWNAWCRWFSCFVRKRCAVGAWLRLAAPGCAWLRHSAHVAVLRQPAYYGRSVQDAFAVPAFGLCATGAWVLLFQVWADASVPCCQRSLDYAALLEEPWRCSDASTRVGVV